MMTKVSCEKCDFFFSGGYFYFVLWCSKHKTRRNSEQHFFKGEFFRQNVSKSEFFVQNTFKCKFFGQSIFKNSLKFYFLLVLTIHMNRKVLVLEQYKMKSFYSSRNLVQPMTKINFYQKIAKISYFFQKWLKKMFKSLKNASVSMSNCIVRVLQLFTKE